MSLAFFDMDGTIIGGDTNDISFDAFLKLGIIDDTVIKKLNAYEDQFYKGELNVDEFVQFAASQLTRFNKDELYKLLDEVVAKYIIPVVKPGAKRAIDFHNKRGDVVVIVTSTMDYLVEHIARQLNIKYFIASPMEKVNGALTGRQAGMPAYKEGKVTKIKEFIKEHNLSLEDSYGYGDTINDLPMLMICEHKYAVDPNKKLLQEPLIKELEIVDWTKQANQFEQVLEK